MTRKNCLLSSAMAAMLLTGAVPAVAQERAEQSDEIVVTAQKREQNSLDVPMSITAVAGKELRAQGVKNILDLSNVVPFVNISRNLGTPNIYIRGIGSSFLNVGGDPSIAFHSDGAYVSRARALISGLYDIERVEVLRGPQGTLYGRNATGGTVNIITRKPTDQLTGYARASLGNYDRHDLEAAVGGPIVDGLLKARLSLVSLNHGGFGRNVRLNEKIDNQAEWGARGQLLFEPADRFSILIIGDYYKADDNGFGWHISGPSVPGIPLTSVVLGGLGVPRNVRNIDSLVPSRRNVEIYGFSGTVDIGLTSNLSAKSITAYRNSVSDVKSDISGGVPPGPPTPKPLGSMAQFEDAHWFSEDAQLLWSSDKIHGLLGVYYFDEFLHGQVTVPFAVLPVIGSTGLGLLPVPFPANSLFQQLGTVKTKAWAVYANLEYQLTDRLSVIGGIRYSNEHRSRQGTFTAPTPFANTLIPSVGARTWDAFTPKGTIDYRIGDDLHLYATVGRGFKSGVLVAGSPNPAVEPETVTSYEAGLKGSVMDGAGQITFAGFYNDYKNLQLNRVVGASVLLENAANAKVSGIEADVRMRLSKTLSLDLQGTWVNSKFGKYDIVDPTRPTAGVQHLRGNHLPQAPEFTLHADIQKTFVLPGNSKIEARADWSWKDTTYFDPFNARNNYQPAYHYIGARLGWTSADDHLSVSLWGKNLTDKTVITAAAISSDFNGFPQLVSLNEPRTFGIDLEFRY